jgi:cytochrome c2
MWVPAAIVCTAIGLWLIAACLTESDQHRGTPVRRRIPAGRSPIAGLLAGIALAGASARCADADVYRAAAAMTGGDPNRGQDALVTYGCVTCHLIPGVREARGLVGPPLTQIASRAYLAGRLPNTPPNILRWIQHPRSIDERTAMPDVGVTDPDARDIAAYLYTLR